MTPAQTLAQAAGAARRDSLELAMLQQLRALRLDDGMEREHRFHPVRQYRFDFAWPEPAEKLALEVDGAIHSRGRHTRGAGYEADCRKFAEALLLGWRVLRVTAAHVRSGEAAQWVARMRGRVV